MLIETKQVVDGEEIKMVINVNNESLKPDSPYDDLRDASTLKKPLETAKDLFGDAINLARNCAISTVSSIQKFDHAIAPDEFELQVAISIDAEVGAVLTKIGGDAQLQITMTWKHNKENKK